MGNFFTKDAEINTLKGKLSDKETIIEDQKKEKEKLISRIKYLQETLDNASIPFEVDFTIIENMSRYSESYKHCQAAAAWVDLKKHDWVKQIRNVKLDDYKEYLNSESKLKSFEEDILHYLELLADSLRATMFLDISAIKPSINSNSSKLLYKKVLTYIRNIEEVQDISPVQVAKLKEYLDAIIGNL